MIGSFGVIVFETGSDTDGNLNARTWNQFSRSGDARYAKHNVLPGKPKLEFQGTDLETVDMQILLDVALGRNPIEEINALRAVRASGQEQRLIIGPESLGKFVIKSLSEDWIFTDNQGLLWRAGVSLKLLEYNGN